MPLKDLAPYMLTMQYAAKESINVDELAQKLGKPKAAILSYIAHSANDSGVYKELRASHGYADPQIPPWFAREGSTAVRRVAKRADVVPKSPDVAAKSPEVARRDATSGAVDSQKPAAIGGVSPQQDTAQRSASQQSTPGDASSLRSPSGDSGSQRKPSDGGDGGDGAAIIKVEMPKVPPGGGKQSIPTSFATPIGGEVEKNKTPAENRPPGDIEIYVEPQSPFTDEEAWERSLEQQGIIRRDNGTYVKAVVNPNGTVSFTLVKPPRWPNIGEATNNHRGEPGRHHPPLRRSS